MQKFFFLLLIACTSTSLAGQTYLGVGADFGFLLREGNWTELYGSGFTSGARIEAGTAKGWIGALHGDLIYGTDVKVDPLTGLRTSVGILGDVEAEARPASVDLRSRGWRVAALGGYSGQLTTTGLGWRVLAGPAYTLHHIRIQDDANLGTSNLRTDYKRGYDRRAGGYGGYGEAGLQYAQADRAIILYLCGNFNVFRSKPLNSVQFDLLDVAPTAGTDIGYGIKAGLVLGLIRPASRKQAEEIYY